MSEIKQHFANLDECLEEMKAEIAAIEKDGHTTIDGAVFLRFTEIEVAVNAARDAVEQHINSKEKKNERPYRISQG